MNPHGFSSNGTSGTQDPLHRPTNTTNSTSNGSHVSGTLFNFAPFSSPSKTADRPGFATTASKPTEADTTASTLKRKSIDESWVNVDWKDLSHRSPPKSPRVEHSETNGLHQETSKTGFGGFGMEMKAPSTTLGTTTTSSTAPAASTTSMASNFNMPAFGFPKSPARDEPPKSPQMAPKSPIAKPVTPAKEPFGISLPPTISSAQKATNGMAPSLSSSSFGMTTASTTMATTVKEPEHSTSIKVEPPTIPKEKAQSEKEVKETQEPERKIESMASTSKTTTHKSRAAPRKSTPVTTPRSSGRTRKTVDRLSPGVMESTHESKTIEIPHGHGTKLGDIPHVAKELSKRKADYTPIVTLHRLIFGRPGEHTKRKANLRLFNGFVTTEDIGKIKEKLSNHTVDELRMICGLLNLEHSGEKKALADRITNYLNKPHDLGESKPGPKKATPQKRSRSAASKKKSSPARRSAKSKSSEEDNDDDDNDDEEDGGVSSMEAHGAATDN